MVEQLWLSISGDVPPRHGHDVNNSRRCNQVGWPGVFEESQRTEWRMIPSPSLPSLSSALMKLSRRWNDVRCFRAGKRWRLAALHRQSIPPRRTQKPCPSSLESEQGKQAVQLGMTRHCFGSTFRLWVQSPRLCPGSVRSSAELTLIRKRYSRE